MHLRRVGILRGGDTDFYNHSIFLGTKAIEHFFESLYPKYKPFDIFLDKKNNWHLNGLPILPGNLIHKVDLIWNFSHPNFTQIIKSLGVPVLGHHSFNHALSSSHELLREHMKKSNIKTTRYLIIPIFQKDIDKDESIFAVKKAKDVFEKFASPWFVYPYSKEPDYSPFLAKTFPELIFALEEGAKHKIPLIVEEFISSRRAEIHLLKNFRNQNFYTLYQNELNDYTEQINFSKEEKDILENFSKKIFDEIAPSYYTKLNIVLDKRSIPYLRNVSFIPEFNEESSLYQAKNFFGVSNKEILEGMMHFRNML